MTPAVCCLVAVNRPTTGPRLVLDVGCCWSSIMQQWCHHLQLLLAVHTSLALHVHHVNNTAGIDTKGCGGNPSSPCQTVRFAISQSGANDTINIQGGGAPYLDECRDRGIVINHTLAVVGLRSYNGTDVGAPVIDCNRKGRAFYLDSGLLWYRAQQRVKLEGLIVRRGISHAPDRGGGAVYSESMELVVRGCSFEDCSVTSAPPDGGGGGSIFVRRASFTSDESNFTDCAAAVGMTSTSAASSSGGGAVMVTGVQVYSGFPALNVTIRSSNFVNCSATGRHLTGGGAVLVVNQVSSLHQSCIVADSSFSKCTSAAGGGGLMVVYKVYNALSSKAVQLNRCSFIQCSSSSGGGAAMVNYRGDHDEKIVEVETVAETHVHACDFVNCSTASAGSGGGMLILFTGKSHGVINTVARSTFTGCTSGNQAAGGGGLGILFNGTDVAETHVHACDFVNCSTASAGSGGGMLILFTGKSHGVINTVARSTFTGCTSGNQAAGGGGLGILFNETDVNATDDHPAAFSYVANSIRDSTFVGCSTSGMIGGGSALVYLYPTASDVTTTFDATSFNTSRSTDLGSYGGGAAVVYFNVGTNVETIVSSCHFTNSTSDGSYGDGGGGGFLMWYSKPSHNTSEMVHESTFTTCAANNRGNGGGMLVHHSDTTSGSTTTVGSSIFTRNNASAGSGGALAFSAVGAGAFGTFVTLTKNNFSLNYAGGAGGGGAVSILLPKDQPQNLGFKGRPNATWKVRNISAASYSLQCGTGTSPLPWIDLWPTGKPPSDFDFDDDPCTNKVYFNCTLRSGCSTCPAFQSPDQGPAFQSPIVPRQNEYRRWDWSENRFDILNSNFWSNGASLSGGALSVPGGGDGSIIRCLFESNSATKLFGGGCFIDGTVRLRVSSSTWRNNSCGQRGCQVFSASGAGISFGNGSTLDLGCAAEDLPDCKAGFAATNTGNVTWGEHSGMSCGAGFQIVNTSLLSYASTVGGWSLAAPDGRFAGVNCNTAKRPADCLVAKAVTSCPCYFSLFRPQSKCTTGYGNATIFPEMLVSTLSYGCRACPAGTYNMTPVWLNDSAFYGKVGICAPCAPGRYQDQAQQSTCKHCPSSKHQPSSGQQSCSSCGDGYQLALGQRGCHKCPYGAVCANGNVSAARGFWGLRDASHALTFYRCPVGYCCNADQCSNFNECEGNRHGPLCGGCKPGFSQTIGSTVCRHSSQCGGASAVWFSFCVLVLAAVYALYALKSQSGTSSGWPLNSVQVTIYFFQVENPPPLYPRCLSPLARLFTRLLATFPVIIA